MNARSSLQLATISLFLGFGCLAWWFGLPWRSLVWDEALFRPVVESFGTRWSDWITSPATDAHLLRLDRFAAFVWWLTAIGLILLNRLPIRLIRILTWLATGLLALYFLLASKENFWRIGYLLEHALQLFTPLVLLYVLRGKSDKLARSIAWLTAATFLGHGLFAMGVHPLPAHFVLMTTEGLDFLLGTNEVATYQVTAAKTFLLLVGTLDLLAAIALLGKPDWQRIALYWIIPWAILTTLARLWSGAQFSSPENWWMYWVPQFMVRLPHVLLPLLLWTLLRSKEKGEKSASRKETLDNRR